MLDNAVIIKSRTETDAYLPEHAMGEFGPPISFRPGMQVSNLLHFPRPTHGG